MKSPIRLLSTLVAISTLGFATRLAAADTVEPSKATVTTFAEPKSVNLDFHGGPLGSLLVLMSRENSGFNVIGEKVDLNVELPPFSLRNANPTSVATAVGGILMPRGYMLQPAGGIAVGQLPVYYLRKLSPNEVQQAGLSQFRSFQLGQYLEQQSVDDIVGAIRAAWELDPAHVATALRLKFHPPTGILLVSGPTEGVYTVETVLTQLRRGPDAAKSGPKPPPAEKK